MTDTTAETGIPAPGAAVPLESLTDEELAVLAGPDGIVVSPFLDRIGADQRATTLRTAYRGLLARGIVDPPTAEALAAAEDVSGAGDDAAPGGAQRSVGLEVRADVHTLITLRGAARAVIAVARTTADGQDFWYAHLVEDVALLEQVAGDGVHRFALLSHVDLPEALVAAVVHPETGDASGEPITLASADDPVAAAPVLERIGAAFIRCDVVVRTVGDSRPVLLGVFTGPRGAWLCRNIYGSKAPVRVEPRTAAAIRTEVAETVAQALGPIPGRDEEKPAAVSAQGEE